MSEPNTIENQVLSAIQTGYLDDSGFNTLALEVFDHQYRCNKPYRNYCDLLGRQPEHIDQWQHIPTVTTDVFKLPKTPVVSFPVETAQNTFLTSGTTTDVKGRHHFLTLDLYDSSIIHCWHELDLPEPMAAIYLTPRPEQAPESSLSHMMGTLAKTFTYSTPAVWAMTDNGTIDLPAIINACQRANASNQPIGLLGTALTFLHLFKQLDTPMTLPPGSWAMETGGYKGTRHQLTKQELYQLFQHWLGLEQGAVINEYSMTELSSQFYTHGLDRPHSGPSWTRVRVIDPVTASDAAPGQPGHLAIYDLANLHSVMAVQTQDIAIPHESVSTNALPCFTLLGRDPSALPRGCSRAADYQFNS